MLLVLSLLAWNSAPAAEKEMPANSFSAALPPLAGPSSLSPDSPFGINTAFHPGTTDLTARLEAMRQAGIKWGRQEFTWKQIVKKKGEYE